MIAGWSSPVARRAHNPKVASSNLAPATNDFKGLGDLPNPFFSAKLGFVAAYYPTFTLQFRSEAPTRTP